MQVKRKEISMKFQVATRYILIHQLISLGIFFIWWILFGILFPVFGLYVSGSNDPVSSDVLIPIVFFSIIISFLSMNSDFKFFIQC
ncbi:ABC transporter permease, partial [Lactococcus lactis]|nr:ABC transporter permease [Lactococcus lactis]